jgi:hypothetical protein
MMRIRSVEEYRRAVAELQRLETAKEGSRLFKRRHVLLAAAHKFEQEQQTADLNPGHPKP